MTGYIGELIVTPSGLKVCVLEDGYHKLVPVYGVTKGLDFVWNTRKPLEVK